MAYRGPPPEGPGRYGEMNGFSTEEDSREGPPAAPAAAPGYGQSCCLIADGERCVRPAGNASFSKRVQKSISQKKLKLDIDKSVSLGAQRRAAGRDPGDAPRFGPRRTVCAKQGTQFVEAARCSATLPASPRVGWETGEGLAHSPCLGKQQQFPAVTVAPNSRAERGGLLLQELGRRGDDGTRRVFSNFVLPPGTLSLFQTLARWPRLSCLPAASISAAQHRARFTGSE